MAGINAPLTDQTQIPSRITTRLERVRDDARTVLSRLDSGEKLSLVLPQAKAVVEEQGSSADLAFWLELEVFGLSGGPGTTAPFKTEQEKAGGLIFLKLHSVRDSTEPVRQEREILNRDKVVTYSVSEIERLIEEWEIQWEAVKEEYLNKDQLETLRFGVEQNKQHERVLSDVRSHVYNSIARLRRNADTELENIALLGPDYAIVLDSLEALDTGVRNELVAALENLSSSNPAARSACALVCRNVILALGRTLWLSTAESYESELAGRILILKGEREKNRLSAFIDFHWRQTDGPKRTALSRLDELARDIYDRGSVGKQQGQVKLADAQALVVDTFRLVSDLRASVGLDPV